ncbi:MAG: hypothetical protein IMZ64_03625 [Bacteroidetes bacterium]|nr:hypothetical protein [Bacteroidota bacterium]
MAVPTLSLSYTERNDNKLITLTDITTDWGAPPVGSITTLTLDVEITVSDNTTTVYDQINLVTLSGLGGGSVQADLVFNLDATDLEHLGTDLGAATDVFPDGIYKFTYILDEGLATESELVEYVLMEGNVRNDVYDALRTIPTLYMCSECKSKQIMDAIFAYGYLNSIRAGGYVAKTEELISQLYVLERLLAYGSSFTW